MKTVAVGSVPVLLTTPIRAVELLLDAVEGGRAESFRFVNAYSLTLAEVDETYRALLASSGRNFADGKPVAMLTRFLSGDEAEQVRGPSIFERTLDAGQEYGVRHFFLGGSDALLCRLRVTISERFPEVIIAGTYSPPFRKMSDAEVSEQDAIIRRAAPDLVWVSLGTPKQDFEAQRLTEQWGLVTAGVGAAFDFFAGLKPTAPRWMQRLGLEWCFRLVSEPRRLWRRYLIGNARFLVLAARELRRG